ncbi:hypothetical protein [Streptomyces sp. 891-h]|uniref:hypothetical protein n=1 Tax=unclassified Streptomyces TaxID=2593676 RepID=UPI001FAABB74|nr:hypothetical protein [Streptomyces sp. 891-h]UNZ19125.1 hypothetical protein HC362_20815 [Streptomyces sp. 891-h]
MSIRGERAGAALRAFGELEWFKMPLTTHPLYGYEQVPYVGWRYKNATNETIAMFQRVAADAPEHLEWAFDSSRRNWLLIPARLSQEYLDDSGSTFLEMISAISETDQEYCRAANLDIDLIIDFLEGLNPAP